MASSDPNTLDAFVQQVVETSFTLISNVAAMAPFHERGSSSADAPPIPDVLRDLLASALIPLVQAPRRRRLTAATRMLGEATDLMCSDIYIVDPSRVPLRERHREAGRTLITVRGAATACSFGAARSADQLDRDLERPIRVERSVVSRREDRTMLPSRRRDQRVVDGAAGDAGVVEVGKERCGRTRTQKSGRRWV